MYACRCVYSIHLLILHLGSFSKTFYFHLQSAAHFDCRVLLKFYKQLNTTKLTLNYRYYLGLCYFQPELLLYKCTKRDFYVALGSSMDLALLVWVGGGLLERVLYFFW